VPVRKVGKLPHHRVSASYDLEYGKDTLEIHADSIVAGQRVLLVDDLLATGGTMQACADLVRKVGGNVVAAAVLIELADLKGRKRLAPIEIHSVLRYE
jgi:adenine phosphoribosyltransferase